MTPSSTANSIAAAAVNRSGAHRRKTTPSLAGELVSGGARQNQGEPRGTGKRRSDEGTPAVLRADDADTAGLGQDRRDGLRRPSGIALASWAMILTGWPAAATTASTAASSGPATIASSVENGATTPMHISGTPLSVAPLTY